MDDDYKKALILKQMVLRGAAIEQVASYGNEIGNSYEKLTLMLKKEYWTEARRQGAWTSFHKLKIHDKEDPGTYVMRIKRTAESIMNPHSKEKITEDEMV